jgi:DNA-binding beta-propeller fold protein YncE
MADPRELLPMIAKLFSYGLACSFLAVVSMNKSDAGTVVAPPPFIHQWGSTGSGPGQFVSAHGLAVAPDGAVYVADTWNCRVQKFTPDGTFVAEWGRRGTGDGEFDFPLGIDVGADGSVYVADTGNRRTQKFSSAGAFITKWSRGDHPFDIAVDRNGSGDVFVSGFADKSGTDAVQRHTAAGLWLGGWSINSCNYRGAVVAPDGTLLTLCEVVSRFSLDGTLLATWGGGELNGSYGITADHVGNVYATDRLGSRVVMFSPAGNLLTQWGTFGNGDGEFNVPGAIDVGPDGTLYVLEVDGNRVQRFGELPVPANATTWGKVKADYRK